MNAKYDEKGKFFTKVVAKLPTSVVLQTHENRIEGLLYISPEDRIKDELNKPEDFIALTDVTIFNLDGNELYRSGFITLNRTAIVWLIPLAEILDKPLSEVKHDS
jgi:hypothetical protein